MEGNNQFYFQINKASLTMDTFVANETELHVVRYMYTEYIKQSLRLDTKV